MLALLFPLIGTALDLLQSHTSGKAKDITKIATSLTAIVEKALAAYQAEVGQPMDLSKLRPYVPLP